MTHWRDISKGFTGSEQNHVLQCSFSHALLFADHWLTGLCTGFDTLKRQSQAHLFKMRTHEHGMMEIFALWKPLHSTITGNYSYRDVATAACDYPEQAICRVSRRTWRFRQTKEGRHLLELAIKHFTKWSWVIKIHSHYPYKGKSGIWFGLPSLQQIHFLLL